MCPWSAAAAPKKPGPPPLLPADEAWKLTLPAAPSAGGAMDRDRVYIPLSSNQLVAYARQTGMLAWMRDVATTWPPLAAGDSVYVLAGTELLALDAATGSTRWAIPVQKTIAPIVAAPGLVLLVIDPDVVVAYHAHDGTAAWTTTMDGATGPYAAAADETSIYVTSAKGEVLALGLEDGAVKWRQMLGGTLSPPTVAHERLLVGSTTNFFYALDPKSGREDWHWRAGGDVIGSAATEDAVYFASLDNVLRAVNRGNGNQRWRKSTMTRPILPPQVVAGEVLLTGLMPTLSTYDAWTGMPINSYTAPGELEGSPLVDPEFRPFRVAAVIVTRDGRVVALRPQSLAFREADPVPLQTLPGRTLTRERLP